MSEQLVTKLLDRLDLAVQRLVREAIRLANDEQLELYAVGGTVRDLLLNAPHLDTDLVVEGDAIGLAERLGVRTGAKVTMYGRFGTATIKLDRNRVDLATGRSEVYARPGILPSVSPASISEDLGRRDFSINALALGIAGPNLGKLIDPLGGRDDLASGNIRVLHDESFRDDATRMFRAVRYAARFGFEIEPQTMNLLKRDLNFVATVSGVRLRREFERIAEERQPQHAVRRASRVGLLKAVDESFCVSATQRSAIGRLPAGLSLQARVCAFISLVVAGEANSQVETIVQRLALTTRQTVAVRDLALLHKQAARLRASGMQPSQVVAVLRETSVDALEAFLLLTNNNLVRDRVRSYLDTWRHTSPRLNGRDIEELGVPYGPEIGAALAALSEACLNGTVSTREDEVVFVERAFGRSQGRVVHG